MLGARPTIALKIGPKRMMGTASKVIPRVVLKVASRLALEAGPTDRAEARVGGRIDGHAQAASHSQLDASGEEDFAGFVKHNIASGGIFGGVLEKGAAPQNRSAADWGIDVAVALVAFAFGCAQMVITASSVVHVDAGPYGSSWVNYVPNIYAYLGGCPYDCAVDSSS